MTFSANGELASDKPHATEVNPDERLRNEERFLRRVP
jgi:hypothetical protein